MCVVVVVSVEEENPDFWRSLAQDTLRSALSRRLNTNVAKNVVLFLGDGKNFSQSSVIQNQCEFTARLKSSLF